MAEVVRGIEASYILTEFEKDSWAWQRLWCLGIPREWPWKKEPWRDRYFQQTPNNNSIHEKMMIIVSLKQTHLSLPFVISSYQISIICIAI